jgi:hypothetical protein
VRLHVRLHVCLHVCLHVSTRVSARVSTRASTSVSTRVYTCLTRTRGRKDKQIARQMDTSQGSLIVGEVSRVGHASRRCHCRHSRSRLARVWIHYPTWPLAYTCPAHAMMSRTCHESRSLPSTRADDMQAHEQMTPKQPRRSPALATKYTQLLRHHTDVGGLAECVSHHMIGYKKAQWKSRWQQPWWRTQGCAVEWQYGSRLCCSKAPSAVHLLPSAA